MNQLYRHDLAALEIHPSIVGVDEAGRGCLAGPVVVAAVRLDYSFEMPTLNDSKKLTSSHREALYHQILEHCLDFAVIEVPHQYIDEHNILQATLHGMRLAAEKIATPDSVIYIDGNQTPPDLVHNTVTVVKGDGLYACIAAASILAKVHRDALMDKLHVMYPDYGFDANRGYGTRQHLQALHLCGPSPIHRMTFHPMPTLSLFGRG